MSVEYLRHALKLARVTQNTDALELIRQNLREIERLLEAALRDENGKTS